MFFNEFELLLLIWLPLEQLADGPQSISTMGKSCPTRFFERFTAVFAGKRLETDQDAHRLDPTRLDRSLAPLTRLWTDTRDLSQQGVCSPLYRRYLLLRDVL